MPVKCSRKVKYLFHLELYYLYVHTRCPPKKLGFTATITRSKSHLVHTYIYVNSLKIKTLPVDGGATSVELLVTASFNILSASFQ